ncbi:4-hydroxybenzoate octaprenyltransferase [Alteromonas gilva]|uniref:4-hydroxybenzoate octaprenyltransferase n=1 Tax=Alteromonas gilva TaxID=2987522 RepID=A0ABT5L7V5_9ALTE|nr:4-hydroxybenzoate octaprenyltransferase [Alteromonas gilva]MDC8831848.1 4-hydroxybenzoate octaprenyltransferase [Alteromonas gilva]
MALSPHNIPHYARLMRLDRPIGIYLLLWPTLWALMLAAEGMPPVKELILFVLGVVVMRSAGCVINDYADRHVDGAVKRTNSRPLVAGHVTAREALQLFGVLILIAFIIVIQLNLATILLSGVALLLASVYPFMKRYTHLPQAVLGAAYGWAIPMAIMAVRGDIPQWGWLLFVANLLWTIAYDTLYAMVDRDDDLVVGIKSTAILFGRQDKLIVGVLQLITLGLLVAVFLLTEQGLFAYLGLVAAVLLFGHQHVNIRHRDRDACFKAFLDNHYVGMVIAIGLFIDLVIV